MIAFFLLFNISLYFLSTQLKAFYSTVGIGLLLTIYACNTHIDYTVCGALLYHGLCVAFVGGMAAMALFTSQHDFLVAHALYGIFLFAFFFIYDTQIMLGGEHFVRIEPMRHNYVVVNLFVDMMMMFYYHLHVFYYFEWQLNQMIRSQ